MEFAVARRWRAVFDISVIGRSGHAKDFQSQRAQSASTRQRSHCVSGLALTGCQGNAPGEMLKWGTGGRPMKVLIPVAAGTISIAFSRRSAKAGVAKGVDKPRTYQRPNR